MKTVIINQPQDIRIKDIQKPVSKKGHAIIIVKSVGICGSDVTAYKGVNPTINYPLILGHEISGTIEQIDEEFDTDLKIGDKVVIEPYIHCNTCYSCEKGIYNNCQNLQVYGSHIDGGMSEKFSVPIPYLYKIPDEMPFHHAALVEPLTIALHGLARSKVKKGEYVVITGAGTIGLLAALSTKAYGAVPILLDIVQSRLDFAKSLGIKHIINITENNPIQTIKNLTNGRLADKMIECSGSTSALQNAINYVTHGANISFVGWPKGDIELPIIMFMKKELNLYGSRCSLNQFPEAIRLIHSKQIDANNIISKIISLSDVTSMVKELSEHPQNYIKVIVNFE